MLRTEAAGYRQRGEPIPPGVLNMISLHSDRFARWATRLSAVPQAVVEVTNQFDSALWSGLLGANHQQAMADAAVVETLPEAVSPAVEMCQSQESNVTVGPELNQPAAENPVAD
jgi:hypothetical protein